MGQRSTGKDERRERECQKTEQEERLSLFLHSKHTITDVDVKCDCV